MATSTEIKQRANTLADKTDVNSITPKEVGGIMYDLASHGENVLRNGGTLGIRKVYESVAAMEADSTNPKDFWGDPIKKGNLVVIYDGTTTGVDNNKIYAFMKPGWQIATHLDAGYATKTETNAKLSELGSVTRVLQLGSIDNASPLANGVSSVSGRNLYYYKVKEGDRIRISHTLEGTQYIWVGFTEDVPKIGDSVTNYVAPNANKEGFTLKAVLGGYLCVSTSSEIYQKLLIEKYNTINELTAESYEEVSGKAVSLEDTPDLMAYAYSMALTYDRKGYVNKCFRVKKGQTLTFVASKNLDTPLAYIGVSEDVAYINLAITSQETHDFNVSPSKLFTSTSDCYLNVSIAKDDWDKVSITKGDGLMREVENLNKLLPKYKSIEGLSPLNESVGTSSNRTMIVYKIKQGEKFRIFPLNNDTLNVWTGIAIEEPVLGSSISQYYAYNASLYPNNIFKAQNDGYLCVSVNRVDVDNLQVAYFVESDKKVLDVIEAEKSATSLLDVIGVVPSSSEGKLINSSNYKDYLCKCFALKGMTISISKRESAEGYLFWGESSELTYTNLPVTNQSNSSIVSFSHVEISGDGYINISAPKDAWNVLDVSYLDQEDKRDTASSMKAIESQMNDTYSIRRMIEPLLTTPINENHDVNTIELKSVGKKKLLLGLHKCANNGSFDSENDAYLPNARRSFSDVRVYDDKGRTLSYCFVHQGNYELLSKKSMSGLSSPILQDKQGVWYGVINGMVAKSSDGGDTWTTLFPNVAYGHSLCCITKNDTMLFGQGGIVYRSEHPYTSYSQVLNENEYHSGSSILNTSIAMDSKGNIYLGHYQVAKDIIVQKSTDDGKTWDICLRDDSGIYQHIHNVKVDPKTDAVYIGCDGGGGVYKSIDYGNTWVDLRTIHPEMPQTTDYGMIFFGDDYKLMSGETSIVGGYSIIKTKDEENYYPVLDAGGGTYHIVKSKNGNLYAGMVSSEWYRQASIFMSSDNGETWNQIYRTALHDDGDASDGFRETSIVEYEGSEYVVFAKQGSSFRTKMLIEGGDNYSAQILVDILEDSAQIYVSSGYAIPNIELQFNEEHSKNQYLYVPLNDGCRTTEYWFKGIKGKIVNDFKYARNGRNLGNARPIKQSPSDMFSVVLSQGDSIGYYPINISKGGFHLGCWVSRNITQVSGFCFIERAGKKLNIWKGSQCLLGYDGSPVSKITYGNWMGEELMRVDINVHTDGVVEVYVNGEMNDKLGTIPTEWMSTFTNSVRLLYNQTPNDVIVQHLEITERTITAEEAAILYTGGINDNI